MEVESCLGLALSIYILQFLIFGECFSNFPKSSIICLLSPKYKDYLSHLILQKNTMESYISRLPSPSTETRPTIDQGAYDLRLNYAQLFANVYLCKNIFQAVTK